MKYEELSNKQQALISECFDLAKLNVARQEIMGCGTIEKVADKYNALMLGIRPEDAFVDVNVGNYTFAVYKKGDHISISDYIDVWHNDWVLPVCEYCYSENEFYRVTPDDKI